jgi:hypothetical protein
VYNAECYGDSRFEFSDALTELKLVFGNIPIVIHAAFTSFLDPAGFCDGVSVRSSRLFLAEGNRQSRTE